jgi:hypothetical protein
MTNFNKNKVLETIFALAQSLYIEKQKPPLARRKSPQISSVAGRRQCALEPSAWAEVIAEDFA